MRADVFEVDTDVRGILKSNGVFEAHRLVAEYKCDRTPKDGEIQGVLIRIYDMGPDSDSTKSRYSWDVSVPDAEDRRPVSANGSDSIINAGHNVHWDQLDVEARKGSE